MSSHPVEGDQVRYGDQHGIVGTIVRRYVASVLVQFPGDMFPSEYRLPLPMTLTLVEGNH